uniref:VWFA domain-containing protein n=1 Tax=Caenorhabditis japonica TaxID=281687 RepID=A0A8R1I5E8_CAEJA
MKKLAQYEQNEDNILPYSPPGAMPPMPPLDPPGYEPELTNDAAIPPLTGLRPPPLPSWAQRTEKVPLQDNDILSESSSQQPKIEDTTENVEIQTEGSGEGSGSGDSGSGDGSGDFFEASGEGGGESFKDIMKGMDKEAATLGVQCPSDIIFIIDATSSVRGIFEQYITFLEKVIEGLDISPAVDHVGAIVYSSEKKQRMKIKLGQHKNMESLIKAVDELPFFSGITATGQALKFAANSTEGRRDNLTLNYVILTDGYSYDIIESGARMLRGVPNSRIFAVTIGEVYLKKELEMITGDPNNVLIGSMSYGTLVKRLKDCPAREKSRSKHDPTNENALVHPGEFMSDRYQHRAHPDANVEEASGTGEDFVKNPAEELPVKDCKYDVGIIFDSSGSLMQNFQRQLIFANELVAQMPIGDNGTRVGIVQFAGKTKTRVLADFRQNRTRSQLNTIIARSPFYSGTTFTNQALKRMAKLFKDSTRPDAKCILVIFTDGYSAEDTAAGIEALKTHGVTIYTVGISTDRSAGLNMNELRGMATSPEHYYDSTDFDSFLEHFPSTKFCS